MVTTMAYSVVVNVVDLQSLIMLVDCGKNNDDGSFLSESKHGDGCHIHDPCCLD